MKRIMLGCFILSSMTFASMMAESDKYIDVKAGMDLYSEYSSLSVQTLSHPMQSYLDESTKMNGFEIAAEGMMKYNDKLDFGLGVAYQKTASRKESELMVKGGDYDSVPLYATVKYKFNMNSMYVPYLKANLGYAFNVNEDNLNNGIKVKAENGMYYALGGGFEFNNFDIELMYGFIESDLKFNPAIEGEVNKTDGNREKLTLSLGYRFNI